jgi:hypothetical protein
MQCDDDDNNDDDKKYYKKHHKKVGACAGRVLCAAGCLARAAARPCSLPIIPRHHPTLARIHTAV